VSNKAQDFTFLEWLSVNKCPFEKFLVSRKMTRSLLPVILAGVYSFFILTLEFARFFPIILHQI